MSIVMLLLLFGSMQAEVSVLLQDFEGDVNVHKWPEDKIGEVVICAEWRKPGGRCLKIDPGLMATFDKFSTRNWKDYDALRVHIKNTGPTAAKLGFELVDKHTAFRERHQNTFGARSGLSTVDIEMSGGLWRGEENKPYLGKIKDPIKTDQIQRISFFNHSDSTVYIDRLELIKIQSKSVVGAYAFDFGQLNSQVMNQMIGVSEKDKYDKSKGYGFIDAIFANIKNSMSFPTPMLGDGIGLRAGHFKLDLHAGRYVGLIAFERGGFWENEYSNYLTARLIVNNMNVHEHNYSKDGSHFYFQDTEITSLEKLTEDLIWPAHELSKFRFDAVTGGNSFELETLGLVGYPLRIAGLIVAPDNANGREYIQHHIDLQKKQIAKIFAPSDLSKRQGRRKPNNTLVVEELPVGEVVYPGNWPQKPDGSGAIQKLAIAGQTLSIHLGIYGTKEQSVVVATNKLSSVRPSVSYGRYLPMRNYGVGTVWLEVNHYRPGRKFVVAPDLTRSVLIEYNIPKNYSKDVIEDVIKIKSGLKEVSIPIHVNISKVDLVDIPIPVGLFMNSLPIKEGHMKSSIWWKLQESLLEEQIGSGLTAISGGDSINYTMRAGQVISHNAHEYIRMASKFGPIHAVVGYGGFFPMYKSLKDNPKSIAKAINEMEDNEGLPPHYINSFDEPRHGTDQLKHILSYLGPHAKAGIRTIGWTSWDPEEVIIRSIGKNTFAVAVNQHESQHIGEILEMGAEPWVYNNGLDRYGMGLHLWRGLQLGVKGRMQWIGLFTQGFAFHNLDGREPSFSCFLIHKKLGALKTPRWLAVREGLLDVRIRLTLEDLVSENGPVMDPWTTDGYGKDKSLWTNEKLEEARLVMLRKIADIAQKHE